jgi:hypothetical protein
LRNIVLKCGENITKDRLGGMPDGGNDKPEVEAPEAPARATGAAELNQAFSSEEISV